jgi:hypothetical protein
MTGSHKRITWENHMREPHKGIKRENYTKESHDRLATEPHERIRRDQSELEEKMEDKRISDGKLEFQVN